MSKLPVLFIAAISAAASLAAEALPAAEVKVVAQQRRAPPDSKQMESDLQNLPWKQFRSVIESVPKMKADVEAYGPAGWKYVEARYKTYGWKKGIDKLDAEQKERLAELIRLARAAR